MRSSFVSSVSDTARWVAVYRAWESERPDALFKDPFAARLAGERGQAMTKLAPRQVRSGWPLAIRTRIIDEMILSAVRDGTDCVVNLGAGLDARPYRLGLPATLAWVEADLPALVEEKERLLDGETPRCSLRREGVNLGNAAQRHAFLDRVQAAHRRVLVLSEGVLVYLEDDDVRALSRDLVSRPAVSTWIADFFSPSVLRMMQRGVGNALASAPLKFAPADGIAFFERLGWTTRELRSIFGEASHLGRAPWFVRLAQLLPAPDPRNLRGARWAVVARFDREP